MVDTSQHSYSESEVEQAIEDLEPKVVLEGLQLESELTKLLNYGVLLEEAKASVEDQHGREYTVTDEYEQFDEWPGTTRPPKIDSSSWVDLEHDQGSRELRKIARQLTQGYDYTVYVIECEPLAPSLRVLERRAKEVFGECPDWVRRAYNADRVFYLGQTSALHKRLVTHATGTLSETPPPADVARISDVTAVGVPFRTTTREDAERLETCYGENLQDVLDGEVFLHFR
ncbi:hypothetical protein HTZ84_22140 [Haloterrigena sp. SYSU A558-1]|uniref:GIY-YIG nuclease family protein n=1 Tax=Haloterrigena gelatinilytica TaxID=2741724 RepID=A0ABX2LHW2_9EURY|nr:hypothetical protein [Haloterrigena gelatinilytica]NUC74968.1 hypothetical protein [Haloterrigena gelatinilytica]